MAHDTFTYLYETQNPTRLTLVRAALTDAGVRLRVRNEHTMQLAGAVALCHEGAVIEVLDEDFVAAAEVLKEFGVRVDYDRRHDRFAGVNAFERLTDRIPVFRSFELVQRIVVAGICLSGLALAALLNFLIRPSEAEVFDGESWYTGDVDAAGAGSLGPFRTGGYVSLDLDYGGRHRHSWIGRARFANDATGGAYRVNSSASGSGRVSTNSTSRPAAGTRSGSPSGEAYSGA